MKKICERGLTFNQVYNENGDVRLCSWLRDGYIGNLLEQSFYDIYHGKKATGIREQLAKGDYSNCKRDACPFIARGIVKEHSIEIEKFPEWPLGIAIGFERVCNYKCTICTIPEWCRRRNISSAELEERYKVIEDRLREVLPYVKSVSANGCGELFCSTHTLRLLSEWKPIASPNEITVGIETNGSLFDEAHWRQIENLGKYHLEVYITVMSFDQDIYQYLSGVSYPIERIENNLRFVKSLRDKGVINYLELATVVQEQNFRTIPQLAERFLEEFGADYVRLRPYEPWGYDSQDLAWFRDLRNPAHPLYAEYKRVMASAILSHPKVHDESGGMDAEWSFQISPYRIEQLKNEIATYIIKNEREIIDTIRTLIGEFKIAVYGAGLIGLLLYSLLENNGVSVCAILDKHKNLQRDGMRTE